MDDQEKQERGQWIKPNVFRVKRHSLEKPDRKYLVLSSVLRDQYKFLFSSELITLTPTKRMLLAKAYIDLFSNTEIPMPGILQEFWDIAQIPWEAIDTIAPKWWFPSVDERRISPKHVEIAKEEDVELELYELQSHINFCQYLLETPKTATIETYDRLIMQVNYTISDAVKALQNQKPDEVIIIVREPFYWRQHHVEPYGNNRQGSRVRGVLYFRKAEEVTREDT